MPESVQIQFPLSITILCYVGVIALVAIFLLLLRINGRLTALSYRLSKNGRSSKLEEPDTESQDVETHSGTRFDEFLNEDTQRRALSKKEQFKAYRKWRTEKGLNWSAKD
jgi:hypothetical protein